MTRRFPPFNPRIEKPLPSPYPRRFQSRRFIRKLAVCVWLLILGSVSVLRGATALESYHLGVEAYQNGMFETALAQYQYALTLDPSLWQAHLAEGNCLYRLNRKQDAVAAYEKSLALHPDVTYQRFLERLKTELLTTTAGPTTQVLLAAPVNRQEEASTPASKAKSPSSVVYLGAAVLPFKATGFEDVTASDRAYFTGTSEGRARLPLSRASLAQIRPSFEIGGEFYFRPRLSTVLEGRLMFKDKVSRAFAGLLGLDYHFYETERFSLGIVPKVGYGRVDIDFGTASWVPGTRSPVTLPEGFVDEGDSVTGRWQGILAEAAVHGGWRLRPKFGLYARAGYMKSFFGEPMITAGSAVLSADHPALLEDNGSSRPAGLDPQGGLNGFTAQLGVAFFN